jgi:hypothetical protein
MYLRVYALSRELQKISLKNSTLLLYSLGILNYHLKSIHHLQKNSINLFNSLINDPCINQEAKANRQIVGKQKL